MDADRAAVPAVSAFLAGVSNPKEQLAGLQARAKRGVPIFQFSGGQTLRVRQNATGTRDADASRSRITAHPHLNAGCAEAVDFLVEQAPQDSSQTGIGTRVSLVFENGDTRLLSETARPDGTRHLLYATVFFPPCSATCPR